MPNQPRSLDEARRLYPAIGFTLYAMTPGGPVTLELLEPGDPPDEPPQALSWSAPTEREVWERAFPVDEPEAVPAGTFMPPEGSPARAELAAALGDDADATAGLAAELAAELAGTAGGLFD